MTMIPFAPAAAPAPAPGPAAPNAPARASEELGAVFSALVDALTAEFLPTDESSTSAAQPPVTEETLLGAEVTEVDPTAIDAAAVVALLLGATTAADRTAPAHVDSIEDGAPATIPAADQITTDATLTDPTDIVPDTDVAHGVPGDADGPAETTATLEAAVDAGPVPPPSDEAADAPAEVLPTSHQGDAVEPAPVTTDDDPAGEPADGDAAGADRATLEVPTAEGPEAGGVETAPVRPPAPSPGPETSAPAAVTGSPAPAPSAPAHAVSSAAAPAEPTPAALPDQLVTVLAPLRRGPDGTHRVAIQLRPDELGDVQIDVQVRGNEIALTVRADLPGTVDLLRASVSELRAQLEAAGFQAGELDVTGHGAGGATDDHRSTGTDRPAPDRATGSPSGADGAADAATDAARSTLSATGLDLRL